MYLIKKVDDARWVRHLHFLTSGAEDLSRAQWEAIEQGMVAMPAKAWADIDTAIGKLCSEPDTTCDYQTVQAIHQLTAKIKAAAH